MTGFAPVVTALALLLAAPPTVSSGLRERREGVVIPRHVTPARIDEVPILMYHVIADPPRGAPWPQLYVSAAEFAAQMAWLRRHGYQAVTLSEVWRNWHGRGALPPQPVVLTFDDGYRSVFENALPVLSDLGWPAVLNLKVGNLREPWGLSERRVRALVAAGWELGAHTITHSDLRGLDAAALDWEVAGSRAQIVKRFGVPVDFFCYPAGRYDERVIAAVRRAGFLGATTTIEGLATADDPFELRRVRVSRSDGVRGLTSALPARTAASRDSAPRAPASDNPA